MNLGEFLSSHLFDLVVIFGLFAMFILGYIQGTIRRLLGILSILFSFLLAGQIRQPLGQFLSQNWTQFPAEYSYMLAYGLVFLAFAIGFSLIIQGFYKHTPLFEKYQFVDEILGGLLGIVQGLLIIGIVIIILDTYFHAFNFPFDPDELKFLRDLYDAYNNTSTADLFRNSIIPVFFAIFGFLIPSDVVGRFPRLGG